MAVVLDSSFLVAYHNERDVHHPAARQAMEAPCSDIFLEALDTFRQQGSFRLSFADATILTVARRREARAVITFDEDFRRFDDIRVLPD